MHAPVKSYHSVHTYPGHSHHEHKTPVVNIDGHPLSLKVNFNSHSSHIHTSQHHFGQPGKHQKSYHVDEPDVLVQYIKKPIIQEVHEVITPYRHRTQKVMPVHEKVETHLPETKHGYHGGDHGYGHGGGHYGGHKESHYGHKEHYGGHDGGHY